MEFRILGAVELLADGRMCDLGSPKERCVLAALLYELGQPVETDNLIDAVWGEDSPDHPRPLVSVYVSRLRRRMREAARDDRNRITRGSGYYVLDVDRGNVDLHQFRALRIRARSACESGDYEQAATLLREAETLWRGPPLAGLVGDWAARVRKALEEEHLGEIGERVEAELRLGRHADLVGEIADLVAKHPLDQRLVGHLMLAQYRSGRTAEALETYRTTHRRFVEELGTNPGPELRELHQRLLSEDPELAVEPVARAASSSGSRSRDNLPRDIPHFTGRAAEIGKLLDWTGSDLARTTVTVVAISGMAGVGKSTFAVHAAHLFADRYPDRLYLNLHAHHPVQEPVDPLSALGILLRTLGVAPRSVPATLEERAALWRALLADRRALIVLDDADDSEQVRSLLPGAAGCLVLITCRRQMMGLPGVYWLSLDTMTVNEAVSLFTQVVGTERADDTAAITEVVRLCGYLPLAIQLQGSRFRQRAAWSIADLAAQLSRSHNQTSHIALDQREIAASLELSHRNLSREHQRLFRLLSLHPGADFSVYVAAAIGDESLSATELALEELLDHHLLNERFTDRFTFHDLTRLYAWHRAHLDERESDLRNTENRVLDYYLYMVARAAEVVYPFHHRMAVDPAHVPAAQPSLSTQPDFRAWIESERTNIISIINYAAKKGWPQHASLLTHLLARFLDTWGYWTDAVTLHRQAAKAWHELGNISGEARAIADLSLSLGRTGRHTEALDCARTALHTFRNHADRVGEATVLDIMGLIFWRSSRYQNALSCHETALAIWQTMNDRHGQAVALEHSAFPLWHMSQYEEAMNRLASALAIYEEVGDLQGAAKALNNIAVVQQHIGCYEEALDRYRKALAISQSISDRQCESITLNNIGNIYRRTEHFEESLSYYRRALRIYRDIGDRRCEADTLNNIGAVFLLTGHYSDALVNHQKALVLAHELAERYEETRSLCSIGDAHLRSKIYAAAEEDYRAALELSDQIGDRYQKALAIEGIGNVMFQTKGDGPAREYWREALAGFEQLGVPEADSVRDRLRTLDATGA